MPERAPEEQTVAEVAAQNHDRETTREAVEQELMAEGRSEDGEHIGQPTE